jgi:hypothetical protein
VGMEEKKRIGVWNWKKRKKVVCENGKGELE